MIFAHEGGKDEANEMITDLEWIKTKLGYWSTPYDYAFFYNSIGEIREKMNQKESAEQSYREALEYNPHFAQARFHLARLLDNNGKHEEAREEIDKFLIDWAEADPETPELAQAMAMKQSH
jgi:tetratricopeptide (TPR) repeat protein